MKWKTSKSSFIPEQTFDFGDAPGAEHSGFLSSYPVTLAQNGARHAEGGPQFGDAAILTTDGQPSEDASQEETSGDPGYTISELTAGDTGQLFLDINHPIPGQLVHIGAWLDTNRDGDWNDPGERVVDASRSVDDQGEVFSFPVPVELHEQTSYMRVRASTAQISSPTGLLPDGEVIDFAVHVGAAEFPPPSIPIIGTQSESITLSETGSTSRFTVHLSAPPTDTATIALSSSDDARILYSPASLQFDDNNWMIPQVVTVTGISDDEPNADIPIELELSLLETPSTANPESLRVEVIGAMPHDQQAFTQGLLLHEGLLYESTGINGRSSLRAVDPVNGVVLRRRDLDQEYFAEGLARVGNELIQLTWQSETAFRYNLDDFSLIEELSYEGEGWGLCYDGEHLIRSDGTDKLFFHDPETFQVLREVSVTRRGQPQTGINELECVGGDLYANIFQSDMIVRIDLTTGIVLSEIDASGLLTESEQQSADVLNGIAYDPESGNFLITGKLWPRLFEVRFVPDKTSISVTAIDPPEERTGTHRIELTQGETIPAGPDWEIGPTFVDEDEIIRQLVRNDLAIEITGSTPYQNPLDRRDVDASGDVSARDALLIINALARIDGSSQSIPLGIPTQQELADFYFYDTTVDHQLSARDALVVINHLAREDEAESESIIVQRPVTFGLAKGDSVGCPEVDDVLASLF